MPIMYVQEGEDWLEAYRKRKPKPFWKRIKRRTFLFWGMVLGSGLFWLAQNVPGWIEGIDMGIKLF